MSTLTNAALDRLGAEAEIEEDETVLTLVDEVSHLRRTLSLMAHRYSLSKKRWKQQLRAINRSRFKCFRQGQSYTREKIACALEAAGMKDAAEVARSTHVDYNIDPVGRYTGP